MLNKSGLSFAALALWVAALSACSSTPKPTTYQLERFDSDISPYAHSFTATAADTCYAARRALLSQGYTADAPKPETVDGSKNFQPDKESHVVIEFHVVCTSDFESAKNSTIYVSAVQDRYSLKKDTTSAAVGLSILGSIALPVGSSADSLVKVSSETIPSGPFYERYFVLVQHYLDVPLQREPLPEPQTRQLEMVPTSKTTGALVKEAPVGAAATPGAANTPAANAANAGPDPAATQAAAAATASASAKVTVPAAISGPAALAAPAAIAAAVPTPASVAAGATAASSAITAPATPAAAPETASTAASAPAAASAASASAASAASGAATAPTNP